MSYKSTGTDTKRRQTDLTIIISVKRFCITNVEEEMAVVVISSLSYCLFVVVLAALGFAKMWKSGRARGPPGPFKWPVIGNLHLLRGYNLPYQAFNDLARKYGQVFSLHLGSVPAVVVQGMDNIRQVLIQKGHHFDSRPNFSRYHQLFHGNKDNSLAFCDWSDLQKKRRDMLKDHTFPKVYTQIFKHLNALICEEFSELIKDIKGERGKNRNAINKKEDLPKCLRRLMENKHVGTIIRFPQIPCLTSEQNTPASDACVDIKSKLSASTCNIFLRYFCSRDLRKEMGFRDFVRNFDEIFYEVNQGYAFDFLPFLGVFHGGHIRKIQKNSESIRKFVLDKVVGSRLLEMTETAPEADYLDALLKSVKFPGENDANLDLETALFALEDIVGGHSAISNFLVKLLQYLAENGEVQERVKAEADAVGEDFVTLDARHAMPYTEAVVMETLRLLSSPIVPHVANRDTSISGYEIKKDTLIFLNNYELNMSETLWPNPSKFDPSRFIDPETGSKSNPGHFIPFGGGKRSCMGYKLVQFVSFVFVANIVKNFTVFAGEKQEVSTGNLALPPVRAYKFHFRVRTK